MSKEIGNKSFSRKGAKALSKYGKENSEFSSPNFATWRLGER